jgi:hypothetical protein
LTDICHGKPISSIGHQTFCPQCKGNFPIVEGVLTTTFYGKGVALAGMKTARGAVLIATQFTDMVEYGGGSQPSEAPRSQARAIESTTISDPSPVASPARSPTNFDIFFHVKHEKTGKNMSNTPYKITVDNGQIIEGVTDENGFTKKVSSDKPRIATIEVPYHANSDTDSDRGHCSCDC